MPPAPTDTRTTPTAATIAGGGVTPSARLSLLHPSPDSGPSLTPVMVPLGDVEALYVHVPFCFHKCHYCDFYSITRQGDDRMSRFVDLILNEASRWTADPRRPIPRPRTVFFGGGTPSLLPVAHMRRLIQGLRERFDFARLEEWTIECNPATVSAEYLAMLREAGVDRLSFGAQSFDRTELQTLERHHDPQDVPRSIDLARAAGFRRLNLDLIYAVPGQSLDSWGRSLDATLALGTPHVSCYGLTYEPNTPMAVKKRLGLLTATAESVELQMFRHARAVTATNGLPAYEISNYAVPGEECRHNLVYWTGGDYLGLGPSAASHVQGWRWRNRPHLGEWEDTVAAERLPAVDVERLSPRQRAGELAMLMLRLSQGLRFDAFTAKTEQDALTLFEETIPRLVRNGLLSVDATAIRITDAGLHLADAIAAEFLA
jgi:oxygen-independent coproporphyrinogen III oxidase